MIARFLDCLDFMKPQTSKDRWTLAIILNALVLPGSGHLVIGQRLRGFVISGFTLFFTLFPLVRYLMAATNAMRMMAGRGAAFYSGIQAMSTAWEANRSVILWCLLGILILWAYGIIDIIIRKRKHKQYEGGIL